MTSGSYTEDSFVEQPAIKLFKSLDWQTLNCWGETFGEESSLGRENRGDVILQNRLYPALVKLNPKAPKLAIDEAILALRRDRSATSAIAANEELYGLFKEYCRKSNSEKISVEVLQ